MYCYPIWSLIHPKVGWQSIHLIIFWCVLLCCLFIWSQEKLVRNQMNEQRRRVFIYCTPFHFLMRFWNNIWDGILPAGKPSFQMIPYFSIKCNTKKTEFWRSIKKLSLLYNLLALSKQSHDFNFFGYWGYIQFLGWSWTSGCIF